MDRPQLPLADYRQLLLDNGLLIGGPGPDTLPGRIVTAVTCDSRAAVPGSLFVCKGAAFKADYLVQALSKGAMAYVSETVYEVDAPCLQVTDIRRAMGLLADMAWGHPSGALSVVGLTGTKGKTTTAYYLKSILDCWRQAEGKHPAGLLSSIVTDDGLQSRPAVLTTPEPLDLQRHLWNAVNADCGYLVMEESSQALKYGRVLGVDLSAAVFLNLGEDHISPIEHPDLEDYFQSKLKIFDQTDAAVLNRDDPVYPKLRAAAEAKCSTILTYSLRDPKADVCAWNTASREEGMAFTAHWSGQEQELTIPMSGIFNISNALAALAVCQLLEVPPQYAAQGLARARVPGRMETYHKDGRTVIVDFAHNGMSLSAVLSAVRTDYLGQPITVVFGSTGDKALDRREGLAQAADHYADRIILTEDDPGHESVEDICADIASHIPYHTPEIVPDREDAVKAAIQGSPAPGVIVLAGKGCDATQLRSGVHEPCVPDSLLARKYLGLPLED